VLEAIAALHPRARLQIDGKAVHITIGLVQDAAPARELAGDAARSIHGNGIHQIPPCGVSQLACTFNVFSIAVAMLRGNPGTDSRAAVKI
jgi:hypothetical protein